MWTSVSKSVKHSNLILRPFVKFQRNFASFYASDVCTLPMKVGSHITGLDIYKDKDPTVVLERSEYPEWVNTLATPLPTLSELRRLPESEATDQEKLRYLKLTRRIQIKKNSAEMVGQKK